MASAIAEKVKAKTAAAGSKRPRPQAYSLTEEGGWIKLLLYGHTGSGKTYFIIGLLLAGEKVLVASSDFGSNGLATVKNELKKRGRLDLLTNIRILDLSTYEDIVEFFESPQEFVSDLDKFQPGVLVWEGFSTFNIDILDEYILSFAPGAEGAGELRHAGFTHTKQDWQGMKRGTLRALRKFLSFRLPDGQNVHKILTCLESAPEANDLTNKTERTALVHGTGRSLMGPAFDVILELFKEEKNGSVSYNYRCEGDSSKYLVKSRGFDIKPVEPAEPERIWRILKNEKN